jgi:putative transposase
VSVVTSICRSANRRKDSLHQFSTGLVRTYDTIFVGNVSASALAKTPFAKSLLDAGWSALRTMLRYKCDFAGATFAEVSACEILTVCRRLRQSYAKSSSASGA